MKSAPCLNCEDRSFKCHSSCEKYREYKAEKQIELEARHRASREESDHYGTRFGNFNKSKRAFENYSEKFSRRNRKG